MSDLLKSLQSISPPRQLTAPAEVVVEEKGE
jgi:hypothetical protein